MKVNLPVSGREVRLRDDQTIISMTDMKGAITYVNRDFLDISGFTDEELIGVNHNIVRHPDMPPLAFKDLWDTAKNGKPWRGIVKNRCKNGDHYWVEAFVTPIVKRGETVGYQSVRSKPTQQQIDAASALYQKINKDKLTVLPKQRDFSLRVSTQFKLLQTLWLALIALMFVAADSGGSSLVYGTAAAGIVLYLLGYFWVSQQITGPMRRIASVTRALANGDLNTRIKVDKPGAVGEIQLGLDMVRARIRATIGRIQEASDGMAVATDQLAAMTDQTDASMQRQMSETDMIATAMQEMSATVQEVAGSTANAAEVANQAWSDSQEGHRVVGQTKQSINRLSAKIASVEEAIQTLSRDSENIGSILEVIRGVAEQTNLLALNAAIEAARAGEQGRGFAVVADEVRALAFRVQSSTDEIQAMIEKLQKGADSAVQAMASSRESALVSVSEAEEAGAALERIQGSVVSIQDLSTQIATAAEQQSAVSEEMSRNVIGISDQSVQTADATRQASESCRHLVGTAQRLNTLTRDYDV